MKKMKHVQLMIKPASSNCNLRCSYCFYEDECKNREIHSYGFMKEEVLEAVVKKALEAAEISCTFGFQGGEPTLAGLDFFRKFISYTQQYKKLETKVSFCLQTNGTLLNEEWVAFLKEHHFLVGISLDGTKDIHDKNRRDGNGKETFQRILKNAKMLMKNGVDVNILCVLTKQSAKKITSIYTYLKKEGFYYHQYIPCLDPLGEERGQHPWSLTPDVYERALKDLFDLWFEDIRKGTMVSVREFDNWMSILKGYAPESCAQTGRCSMQNIVEANGDLFPCDFYVLDEHRIANIQDKDFQLFEGIPMEKSFFKEGMKRGTGCKECKWYPLCRGGCKRDYTEAGRNYFCSAYQGFFTYAIERMEWIVRYMM